MDEQKAPLQPAWEQAFAPRELAQIRHARVYAADHLDAGAPGHGQFLLIAALARLLDAWEPHENGKVTAAAAPTTSINEAMSAIEDIAELVGWPCFDSNQAEDNFSMQFKLGGL